VRVLIATAGLLALAGAAAAGTTQPHTLSRSKGPVDAITQDGRAVAWLASGGSKCNVVHVVRPGSSETMPQPSSGSMTCHWNVSPGQSELAFAGGISSALWTLHESGSVRFDYVMSARAHGDEQQVDRLVHASDGTGWWLGGVAGAGTTLAYSKVQVDYVNPIACANGGSCKKHVVGGGIYTVKDGQATQLPGTPPALELAASGHLLAYVPARMVAKSGAPAPDHSAQVTVVNSRNGTIVGTARPDGLPLAIAVAPQVLAVLTRFLDGRHDRVTWYDPESGYKLGSLVVPRTTAAEITTSDRTIVYRVGTALRGIVVPATASGSGARTRSSELARPAGKPVGLSLLRNRLVWAENTAKTSRIRELILG
jgi:hypothetical protein